MTLLSGVVPDGKKTIKFYGIGCPETSKKYKKDQAYGIAAKKKLEASTKHDAVDLGIYTKDSYGQSIAVVYFDGQNLNRHLVDTGAV